jgi:hypothetical protein
MTTEVGDQSGEIFDHCLGTLASFSNVVKVILQRKSQLHVRHLQTSQMPEKHHGHPPRSFTWSRDLFTCS